MASSAPAGRQVYYPLSPDLSELPLSAWASSRWHQRRLDDAPRLAVGAMLHRPAERHPEDGGIVWLVIPADAPVPEAVLAALGDGVYALREAPGADGTPSLPADEAGRAAMWREAVAVVLMPGCVASLSLAVEARSSGVPVLVPKGDPADELVMINGIGAYGVQGDDLPSPDVASLSTRLSRLAAKGFAVQEVDLSQWEWDRWADRVVAESRTCPAAAAEPAAGRYLILSLTPLTGNLAIEGLLARSLRQAGHEVAVLRCNGVRERCTVDLINPHVGGRTALCLNCTLSAERALTAWNGEPLPTLLLDDWVDPAVLADAYALVEACPDDQLFQFAFDGLPLGSWISVALRIEYFGEDWRLLPDLHRLARVWLRGVVAVAVAVAALLQTERPAGILLLGGLLPWEKVSMALARRYGIRCLFYEGGQRPGSIILRDETPACEYDFAPEWRPWADVPLSVAEAAALDGFLRSRQQVGSGMTYVFSPAASGELHPIRERLGLQPGRSVLVAFTSIVVDTISFEAQAAFPSQAAWLEACVAYAEAHPDVDLVVRVHPAEYNTVTFRGPEMVEAHEQAEEVIRRRWPVLPANVHVIGSDDPTSSYDILALATVVLCYISTMGMEAAAGGWPVITAGRTHYGQAGMVWQAENPDHFTRLLDRLSSTPEIPPYGVERARRYLYFWFFRCTPIMPGLPLTLMDLVAPPQGPLPYWDVPGDAGGVSTYVDYVTGHGPFVAPPPAGRPRDGREALPVKPPAERVLLFWPQGWSDAALTSQVLGPLQVRSHRWTLVVMPAGSDWQEPARHVASLCRTAGLDDRAVRFVPGPVDEEDLHRWLVTASAVATRNDEAGAPEALVRAYGIPAWERLVGARADGCG